MPKATLDGKLMFPSAYLCATEFQGKDMTLTIAGVSRDELQLKGGAKKKGIVVTFEKTEKKLVLNATNSGTIAGMHGTEARKWIGKRITLFPTTCPFGKAIVDCIRIRDRIPQAAPPAQREPGDEDLDPGAIEFPN